MRFGVVTGASGFVGSALSRTICSKGLRVLEAIRSVNSKEWPLTPSSEQVMVGDICASTNWSSILPGADFVIHCAARTRSLSKKGGPTLAEYRTVNVEGTKRLAEQSAAFGVRRVVYLSSIAVNGQRTTLGAPFLYSHAPSPVDAYGISKWEAEQVLCEVSARTGLEVVVVRPPLVYGPGVKGNLARLLELLRLGLPLPLGSVKNRRSLIGLENLVDLLIRCIDHPAASGQTFSVSDGEDLSTPELLSRMAVAMGSSAHLVPVPVPVLRLVGYTLGKQAEIDRLVESLQIDSTHTRQLLNWAPPVSVQEGIRRMVCST